MATMILAGAIMGAIIGSFVATLVIRWPQERSVLKGRSLCDGCGAPLSPLRLVPLFSHVWQRGRAACCGAPIDPLHLITEILAALVGGLSAAVAGDPVHALWGALFGWLLLALALLDLRHMWLPDRLTAPLALLGLAAGLAGMPPPLSDRLIGGAAAFALFLFIRHGYRLARGVDGMGGGDVKLFGAIGLWLGWHLLPFVLLGAALTGLLCALVAMAMGSRVTRASPLPFGLFLALAAWLAWLWSASAL